MHTDSHHRVRIIPDSSTRPAQTSATAPSHPRRHAEHFRKLLAQAAEPPGSANLPGPPQHDPVTPPPIDVPTTPRQPVFIAQLSDQPEHVPTEPQREADASHRTFGALDVDRPHDTDTEGLATIVALNDRSPIDEIRAGARNESDDESDDSTRNRCGVACARTDRYAGIHADMPLAIAPPAPVADARSTDAGAGKRMIDAIVRRIGNFCSNPVVLSQGNWHLSVPIDTEPLQNCTVDITISRFDLTLRFQTADLASAQLILRHQTTLRDNLTQAMYTPIDRRYGIEIIVN
ncbi:hypothetical protein G3O00_16070 [Burkholderia sp. Ac-20384]|uniref:type III secretion system protein SctP n=1 Tax=Burkholderia sp. Ac-20384 TaxID=2703902 RepID=UPI001981AA8F|nr:type III secretion system protein SctP [Burkholderia sp. Ac-20384]MBN3825124.1 hypothetical protein [Burkholderia sp. Ac-20384]